MIATHRTARRAFARRLQQRVRSILRPPPRILLSAWADKNRHVTRENFGYDGRWETAAVPALREIMDALSDPDVQDGVFIKPSRVGATEAVIVNGTGYFIDLDPSSILIVQPTQDDAGKFSKEKLQPMLDASPNLRGKIPAPRAKNSANTILNKRFPGGKIGIIGTNAPRQFRQRDFRIVLCDEVDGYPRSSGKEGDPVALAFKRADNFDNRKRWQMSSPTLKGASRIETAYKNSDQRKWFVTCPHCGGEQQWQWKHVQWDKSGEGAEKQHLAETAHYACAVSGCVITEREKYGMNAAGRWIAQNPGHPVRGYQCSALASNLPGAAWPKLVREFLEGDLQVFVNQVLAETYEVKGEVAEKTGLMARRETYAAEVPAGVGVLTAGIDLQADRIEVLVRGWGDRQESWRIAHEVLYGDPDDDALWGTLDSVLYRSYQHEGGAPLRIRCALIDSGYRSDRVYAYVKSRQKRGIFASKGDKGDPRAPIVTRAKKPSDAGVRLVTIGTFPVKRRLFKSLQLKKPGPGYLHFNLPKGERLQQDEAYFAQFEAEQLVIDRDRFGHQIYRYEQVEDRNEAIDLECGAFAALHTLGPVVWEHLDREVTRVIEAGKRAAEVPQVRTGSERVMPRAPRTNFVTGWRQRR